MFLPSFLPFFEHVDACVHTSITSFKKKIEHSGAYVSGGEPTLHDFMLM